MIHRLYCESFFTQQSAERWRHLRSSHRRCPQLSGITALISHLCSVIVTWLFLYNRCKLLVSFFIFPCNVSTFILCIWSAMSRQTRSQSENHRSAVVADTVHIVSTRERTWSQTDAQCPAQQTNPPGGSFSCVQKSLTGATLPADNNKYNDEVVKFRGLTRYEILHTNKRPKGGHNDHGEIHRFFSRHRISPNVSKAMVESGLLPCLGWASPNYRRATIDKLAKRTINAMRYNLMARLRHLDCQPEFEPKKVI